MSDELNREPCKIVCFYAPSIDGPSGRSNAVVLRCSGETVALELENNGRDLHQWTLEALPWSSEKGVVMVWEGEAWWTRGAEDLCFDGYWRVPTVGELLDLGPSHLHGLRTFSENHELSGLPVFQDNEAIPGQHVILTSQDDPAQNGVWRIDRGPWKRPQHPHLIG